MLAVSGKLDLAMGGPGFDLFAFEDDHSPRYHYDKHNQASTTSFRRSIYRTIVRSVPDPLMDCLDCADASQNVPVRNETITALQALAMMNNPFLIQQSRFLADRLALHKSTPIATSRIYADWRGAVLHRCAARPRRVCRPAWCERLSAGAQQQQFVFVD